MVTTDSGYKARVILLGASNLAHGASHAAMLSRYLIGSPIQVIVASGYGRSYGQPTKVLGRTLPAILDAGFWAEISCAPKIPTYALVTDIGNDIFYQAQLHYSAGALS